MAIDLRLNQFGSLFSEGIEADALTRADLRRRRNALFAESLRQRAARIAGVAMHALQPGKFRDLTATVDVTLREGFIKPAGLPDPSRALTHPDGLCGVIGDLSPEALIDAYSAGLHPRPLLGVLAWWSPSYRMVVAPGQAKIPGGVRGHLRKGDLQVSFDKDFDEVLARCAATARERYDGSAHPPALMKAYGALHDAGLAHSFEVRERGRLIAGGFGVGAGSVFVTEQTFGSTRDAVDLGLVVLNRHLTCWGFVLHDGKTDLHFADFNARSMPRAAYLDKLPSLMGGGKVGRWSVDRTLCEPGLPAPAEAQAA